MEESTAERGSSGGKMRAANLSKEQRSKIASDAARARWERKKQGTDLEKLMVKITDPPFTLSGSAMQPAIIYDTANPPDAPQDAEKHCPACVAGQSLEESEGTHILATVEHPVTLPTAFADAEASVAVPAVPQKPKRTVKPMPKEFKSASSYAEKRHLQAVKEKADHVGEIEKHVIAIKKLDAEIGELIPIIKALGGRVDTPQPQPYPNPVPYQPQPSYGQQPQYTPSATEIPAPPKPMRIGGAGALDILMQE